MGPSQKAGPRDPAKSSHDGSEGLLRRLHIRTGRAAIGQRSMVL